MKMIMTTKHRGQILVLKGTVLVDLYLIIHGALLGDKIKVPVLFLFVRSTFCLPVCLFRTLPVTPESTSFLLNLFLLMRWR